MKTRLITSAVGLVVLAVVLSFFQTPVFNVVLALISLTGMHEAYAAIGVKKPAICAGVVPMTAAVFFADTKSVLFWGVLYATAIFLGLCVVTNSQTLDFCSVGGFMLFSAMILACFYSILYLRAAFPRSSDALYFIVLGLGIAWGRDPSAYFAGRFFGKHKLAPVVSPHKTVEGAVGGVLGSVVFALAITAIYLAVWGAPDSTAIDVRFYLLVALAGAVGSVLGILGDLTASAVKRQRGIKDYGTIFPGHGGILDRFDSVLLVMPMVSLLTMTLVGIS